MLVTILSTFTVCWLPYQVAILYTTHRPDINTQVSACAQACTTVPEATLDGRLQRLPNDFTLSIGNNNNSTLHPHSNKPKIVVTTITLFGLSFNSRTNTYLHCFFPSTIQMWNSLPSFLQSPVPPCLQVLALQLADSQAIAIQSQRVYLYVIYIYIYSWRQKE